MESNIEKYKISEEEFEKVSLKKIANNPSSQSKYSGASLSAEQLKERMDKPFKLFKDKLNLLISLIGGTEDGDTMAAHMLTGISDGHTVKDLIADIVSESADFAGYLSVGDTNLLKKLELLTNADEAQKLDIDKLKSAVGDLNSLDIDIDSDIKPSLVAAINKFLRQYTIMVGNLEGKDTELGDSINALSGSHNALSTLVGSGSLSVGDDIIGALSALKQSLDNIPSTYIKQQDANEKFLSSVDKDTQFIQALTVKGDLTVEGKTIAQDIESLEVKDAFIVTNSDGKSTPAYSGLVISLANNEFYGLLCDANAKSLKLGKLEYVNDKYQFVEGEAQSLATRVDMDDGKIPQWDAQSTTFKDSGKKAEDIVIVESSKSTAYGNIPMWDEGNRKLMDSGQSINNVGFHNGNMIPGNVVVWGNGKLVSSQYTPDALRQVSSAGLAANALKGKASGEVIRLDDVSPLSHTFDVKVRGKNLFDVNDFVENTLAEYSSENGENCFWYKNTNNFTYSNIIFEENTQYTFSFDFKYKYKATRIDSDISVMTICYTDGTAQGINIKISKDQTETSDSDGMYTLSNFMSVKFTSSVDKTIEYIRPANFDSSCTIYIKNMQIKEASDTDTGYTPYTDKLTVVEGENLALVNEVAFPLTNSTVTIFEGDIYGSFKFIYRRDGATFGNQNGTLFEYVVDGQNKAITPQGNQSVGIVGRLTSIKLSNYCHPIAGKIDNIKLVAGDSSLTIKDYLPPANVATYDLSGKGELSIGSVAPTVTLITNGKGAEIDVEYNIDINKAFAELYKAILSTGGNV